jgi:hypothetical protein
MKKIKITFGTGEDSVVHNIEVSHPQELINYVNDLHEKGWDLCEITSIVGGWTF